MHGYCLRAFRPSLDVSHRIDVGGDLVEASVFLTKKPCTRLFPAALQIARVRRYLDRSSAWDFLQQIYSNPITEPNRLIVESNTLSIACRYEFSTSVHSTKQLEILFETTSSQMFHFIMGAILLERRVLFVARNEQRLSDTMYAIDSLLVQANSPFGYPHNFVPILPYSLLEQGLGNPTSYMVGMLKSYLKVMDSLKDLGDIVIVDLDNKQIRLSPGSAPLIPLGVDGDARLKQQQIQQQQQASQIQGINNGNDEVNPWLDVTTPFCKDVSNAYAQRDCDLLSSALRSIMLLLGSKLQGVMEDVALRSFHNLFKMTSIYSAQVNNDGWVSMSKGGYPQLRSAFSQQILTTFATERQNANLAKQVVLEGKEPVNQINKMTMDIAKRSFDTFMHREGTSIGLKQKFADCSGRNWKNGYKALGLATFLVRTGSELCVSECWDDLKQIFDLTRFSLQGVVGVPTRVAELVQKRAQELYLLVVDLHALAFARSMNGHLMVQRTIRTRMQGNVKRIAGRSSNDLDAFLSVTMPLGMLVDNPPTTPTSAAMNKPPTPPPPPPPQPATTTTLLDLDFDSSPRAPRAHNNFGFEDVNQAPTRPARSTSPAALPSGGLPPAKPVMLTTMPNVFVPPSQQPPVGRVNPPPPPPPSTTPSFSGGPPGVARKF